MQFPAGDAVAFNGLYRVDAFALFAKGATYALAALALFMSGGFLEVGAMERFEYSLLIVFASLGTGVMLSANDLMTLYVGVETLSLSVLRAGRLPARQPEVGGSGPQVLRARRAVVGPAALRLVADLRLHRLEPAMQSSPRPSTSVGLIFGLVLMICGLAFKASAAPFHIWTPDVYEGAPTPVVAFFATAPKIAAVVLLAHVLFTTFGPHEDSWRMVIAIISAISMLIGAFGALVQNNLKRLLAYSSIANVGFALIGIAAGRGDRRVVGAGLHDALCDRDARPLRRRAGAAPRRRARSTRCRTSTAWSKRKPGMALGLIDPDLLGGGHSAGRGLLRQVPGASRPALRADLLWLVLVGAALERGVAGLLSAPGLGDDDEAAGRAAGPHRLSAWRRRCSRRSILAFPVLTVAHPDAAPDRGAGRGRLGDDARAVRQAWPVVRFDEINSTNEEARRRAARGDVGPVLACCASARRRAGAGSAGSGTSPDGNLFATALFDYPRPPARGGAGVLRGGARGDRRGGAAGVDAAALRLKWPNDVLVGDGQARRHPDRDRDRRRARSGWRRGSA